MESFSARKHPRSRSQIPTNDGFAFGDGHNNSSAIISRLRPILWILSSVYLLFVVLATGRKNCSFAKTARVSLLHNPHEKKTLASALPCSSGPYAAAGQFAITRWRTPTKLTGDPDLPLHNTSSVGICVSCITFHKMSTLLHCSKFINVSIIIVASSSIGAGDDHETDAGCFGARADSNCFFVTRK